ncbi:MAG TPA: PHP-associated domain-containing protein [Methanomicrobiales archaeon]|nr:PHP-associated domain-containing protein [Methanomicrobiales archaeon]
MHVHSSYSRDSMIPPRTLFRNWKHTGIVPLVCDHDTLEGSSRVMRAIHAEDPEIPQVLAEEVTTKDGEIIGLFLSEEIPPGLPAAETLDRIRDQGGLSLVPHPFSAYRSRVLSPGARNALVDRIDLVEGHNARNLSDEEDRLAVVFASEMGIPFTAGSDAHTPLELGRVWMDLPPFGSPGELLKGLAGASFTFQRMNRGIHLVTGVFRRVRETLD